MGNFAHAWPFFVLRFISAFILDKLYGVEQDFGFTSVESQLSSFILDKLYESRAGFWLYSYYIVVVVRYLSARKD